MEMFVTSTTSKSWGCEQLSQSWCIGTPQKSRLNTSEKYLRIWQRRQSSLFWQYVTTRRSSCRLWLIIDVFSFWRIRFSAVFLSWKLK